MAPSNPTDDHGPADAQLVALAQGGDRSAADALLRRHYETIYAVCRRMLGQDADAQDATQDALLAIVKGLPRFDGRASVRTWIYRIAINTCLDELRRRRRRPEPDHELVERRVATLHDPSEAIDARLTLDALLEQLPSEYRAAVVLRDIADLEYAAIAEVLGIPDGTVRSRISRGRLHLSRIVAADTAVGEPTVAPPTSNP
jgi:RNA polymerase sigma-70 factor (ECF subfamily)